MRKVLHFVEMTHFGYGARDTWKVWQEIVINIYKPYMGENRTDRTEVVRVLKISNEET